MKTRGLPAIAGGNATVVCGTSGTAKATYKHNVSVGELKNDAVRLWTRPEAIKCF